MDGQQLTLTVARRIHGGGVAAIEQEFGGLKVDQDIAKPLKKRAAGKKPIKRPR